MADSVARLKHGGSNKGDGAEFRRDDLSAAVNQTIAEKNAPPPGGKKPAKSRRERALDQVNHRVNKCLSRLRQVANLGNRQSYEFSDDEYARILAAILEGFEDVRKSFEGRKVTKVGFQLRV